MGKNNKDVLKSVNYNMEIIKKIKGGINLLQ